MIGNTYDVLVSGGSKKDASVLSGYCENGKLVNFKGPAYLKGAIVPVKIKESHAYSLIGELLGDPLILKAKDVAYLLSCDPLLKEFETLTMKVKDKEIKELGEEYVKRKKALAESIGDETKHAAAKKSYEEIAAKIKGNPILANIDSLSPLVESELIRIKGILQ